MSWSVPGLLPPPLNNFFRREHGEFPPFGGCLLPKSGGRIRN